MCKYSNNPLADARIKRSHDRWVTDDAEWQRYVAHEEDVDLEKEINEYMSCEDNNPFDWDWRDKRDCARHFYELGLNARKEE